MRLIASMFLLISLGTAQQNNKCVCQMEPNESPVLGNVDTGLMKGGRFRILHGRVLYPNGEPVENAIVEVFTYPKGIDNQYLRAHLLNSRDRKTACMTGENGRFCFTGLSSGKYLLRIGTRRPDQGFSAILIAATVDLREAYNPKRGLEVYLAQSI